MSSEQVPAAIENLLLIVCGNEWPTGDTGQLRSDAVAWRNVGQSLSGVQQMADGFASLAEAGMNGAGGASFTAYWNNFTAGDQAFIPTLIEICDALAQSLDDAANQIETIRIDIVISVAILAAELAWDASMAFFTAGASEAAAPIQIAATRAAIMRLTRKAATELVIHEVKQTLLQALIDFIAQIYEKLQGNRGSINMNEVGLAAANGAVGSAVGFGSILLIKGLGKGIAEVNRWRAEVGIPSGLDGANKITTFSAKLVADVGLSVATGAAQAAAQDAALNAGQVSQGDLHAGAMNGVGNGVFGRVHRTLNDGAGPLDMALVKGGALLDGQLGKIKAALSSDTGRRPESGQTESLPPMEFASPVSGSSESLPPMEFPSPHSGSSESASVYSGSSDYVTAYSGSSEFLTANSGPSESASIQPGPSEFASAQPQPVSAQADGLPGFGANAGLSQVAAVSPAPGPDGAAAASGVPGTPPPAASPSVPPSAGGAGPSGSPAAGGSQLPVGAHPQPMSVQPQPVNAPPQGLPGFGANAGLSQVAAVSPAPGPDGAAAASGVPGTAPPVAPPHVPPLAAGGGVGGDLTSARDAGLSDVTPPAARPDQGSELQPAGGTGVGDVPPPAADRGQGSGPRPGRPGLGGDSGAPRMPGAWEPVDTEAAGPETPAAVNDAQEMTHTAQNQVQPAAGAAQPPTPTSRSGATTPN